MSKGEEGQLCQYEYHTADIRFVTINKRTLYRVITTNKYFYHLKSIHVGGSTINEAFEQQALAMMNYMVELSSVDMIADKDDIKEMTITAKGHDMDSLLFAFMDEYLFTFSTEFIVFKEIHIESFDRDGFTIVSTGRGVELDKSKHTTGTEIKAITYSCMEIKETKDQTDIFVIVDI
ncbi:hypothetical protein DFA_00010 [Cavenderia fasciculata]|uniref:Archease domain-containing protein n=1 Tax=Cavenderia fasciculata TaxID=261658 RepID=F4PXC3_CACFS|nr:uncharacterized protein DFA_00010 [Cavenderia fasciculata]EGG19433.1 hypothetical protein DFA_00010 [Cavenderia fasciculata]|eukprot:XP_004357727.1 hypothetical protein DFA_00010 [Cavenderia fasciculata]